MTETRQITYLGSGQFVRGLVQALEGEGVTVTVRRNGPSVGEHRHPRGMGDAVGATLVAVGATQAITAGVWTFRQRFPNRASVTIEGEARLSPTQGGSVASSVTGQASGLEEGPVTRPASTR
jgi:hypothetical protein